MSTLEMHFTTTICKLLGLYLLIALMLGLDQTSFALLGGCLRGQRVLHPCPLGQAARDCSCWAELFFGHSSRPASWQADGQAAVQMPAACKIYQHLWWYLPQLTLVHVLTPTDAHTLHLLAVESLSTLLAPEFLCGDNQYSCDFCVAKVDATRQLRLRALPPMLCLSLQRFVFDYNVSDSPYCLCS